MESAVVLLSVLVCVGSKSVVQDRHQMVISYTTAPNKTKEQVCNRQFLDIVVSPLVTKTSIRNLELTWEVDEVLQGDWIGMYVQDPANQSASPVYTVRPTAKLGWKSTPFEEKRMRYDAMYEPRCLGFWAVYWRVREVIAKTCLQSNPTWMYDNKDLIGKLKLSDLFWPGTHNSGAYVVKENPYSENRYQEYVYTQDESILNQLVHGVRYLDLRVGYNSGTWWLQHNFIKIRPLQYVIDDIKAFMSNTEEIVIVDFHRFLRDFNQKRNRHSEFLEYLKSQFSNQMASPALSWSASLDDVWSSKKRLIISYNNKSFVEKMEYNIWEPVVQKWANVRDLRSLRDYFVNVIRSNPRRPWAAMAQFTPDTWDVVLNKLGGLRKMADTTNRYATQWFRGPWGRHSNIVAMDFVRSSGIVNAAVEWNIMRQNDRC